MRGQGGSASCNVGKISENQGVSGKKSLVALFLQVLLDTGKLINILLLLSDSVVDEWDLRVVLVVVLFHLKIVAGGSTHEYKDNEVEGVHLLAVQEFFVSRGLHIEFLSFFIFEERSRRRNFIKKLNIVLLTGEYGKGSANLLDNFFLRWLSIHHFHHHG